MNTWIENLLAQISQITGAYIPKVVGAAILLVIAWIVATILRAVVRRAANAARLDQRAGSPVTGSLGDIAYWTVFLFFLPGVLETLGLQQLLVPVQAMVGKVLGFLPNLLGAALIFVVGYFVARLVRQIVSSLLAASGTDHFSEHIGLSSTLGAQKLSGILGLIVFTVMMIPVVQGALDALALRTITEPIQSVFSRMLLVVPALLSAAAVLIVSWFLGRVLGQFVTNLLHGVGFNVLLMRLGWSRSSETNAVTPSEIVGRLVTTGVMFFAVIEAAQLMGFASLSGIVTQFTVFSGQILTGVVVLGVGLYLSNLAVTAIRSSGVNNASTLATAARIGILVLVGAMGLRQMGIASEIINLAFGLLLGAVAVSVALAFGIGGRESAAKLIEDWRGSLNSGEAPDQRLGSAS